MNKKFLITAGALLLVVILLWAIPKIFMRAPKIPDTAALESQKVTPTENQNGQIAAFSEENTVILNDQADREYAFAFDKAREWRNDSILMSVIVKYEKAIDVKNGRSSYIFASPSLPGYFFDITLRQDEGGEGTRYERLIRFKEDFTLPEDINAIPLSYWNLNFIDALKKADEMGGKQIRESEKEYDVNMVLYTAGDSYLAWNIEYLSEDNVLFRIPINAFNGEEM